MADVVRFGALQVGDAGGCTAGRWRESDGGGTWESFFGLLLHPRTTEPPWSWWDTRKAGPGENTTICIWWRFYPVTAHADGFLLLFFFFFFYHVVKYFSCNMHLELSRYYSVYICGDVCLHICRCNWVCTCTEICICVCMRKWERGQETKKCVRDGASLFIHIPQTNSLCFSVLHQMHFIFLEHADRNQFWGNGEPGFVCLGQDGTVWSL